MRRPAYGDGWQKILTTTWWSSSKRRTSAPWPTQFGGYTTIRCAGRVQLGEATARFGRAHRWGTHKQVYLDLGVVPAEEQALKGRTYVSDSSRVVLVTGAAGFIGCRVVAALLGEGCERVRCFVRPTSRLDRLSGVIAQHDAAERVEVVAGDLMSPQDCRRAAEGIEIVLHLAAGFDKSFAGAFMNSAISDPKPRRGFPRKRKAADAS